MRIAVHSALVNWASVEEVLAEVRRTAELGLAGYWAPMLAGQDTLTVLALAGREVSGLELGTAVVPMPLRSAFALALQARTVQEVIGGRLHLAIGTSHESLARGLFGADWPPPVPAARAYLAELRSILSGDGERRLAGASGPAPQILLGAVNPAMVRLAVEETAGVVTWAAGEATLAQVVGPAVREHGRGESFRVVAALPVSVTDDPAAARAHIHRRLGANDRLPSYRRVLEREGVTGLADLSVVGTPAEVRARLARLEELGVTDFAAHPLAAGDRDRQRTWELLGSLAGSRPASSATG
jgi:F420-dependent oxidoreductase-like protein